MQELFEEYAAYRTKVMIERQSKEAREEGRKEGREEGREEILKEVRLKTQKSAKKMSQKGYAIEVIAELLDETEETIEAWLPQE